MTDRATYTRQASIFNPQTYKGERIALIGAGATGSFTALLLAKMGLTNITVWDGDKVEPHNLPIKAYQNESIGRYKVSALYNMIYDSTGSKAAVKMDMWDGDDLSEYDIILNMPDGMATRKRIWDAVKLTPKRAYLETRTGGEVFRVYSVDTMNPKHIEAYEQTLYESKDVVQTGGCSAETSIVYNSTGVATFLLSQLKKMLLEEEYDNEIIFDFKCMILMPEIHYSNLHYFQDTPFKRTKLASTCDKLRECRKTKNREFLGF